MCLGDQSWTISSLGLCPQGEAEASMLWPLDAKCWLIGKDPWWWERLKAKEEGQRMSITSSMDMSLSKLWETVKDREGGRAAVHGVTKSQTWLSNGTQHHPWQLFPNCERCCTGSCMSHSHAPKTWTEPLFMPRRRGVVTASDVNAELSGQVWSQGSTTLYFHHVLVSGHIVCGVDHSFPSDAAKSSRPCAQRLTLPVPSVMLRYAVGKVTPEYLFYSFSLCFLKKYSPYWVSSCHLSLFVY